MTDTPLPLAGGDAPGDSTPENQIPPRSPTTNADSSIPSPVPDALESDLQVHSHLTTSSPDTREIEPVLREVQAPTEGSSKVAAESPSAARLPPDNPRQLPGRHPLDQQAGTAATVFLPDLAQDIQLQESFNLMRRGLKGNHAEEEEDPLTLDLIQRCINHEILHPPMGENFMATVQGAAVMEKEKRRFTWAEKGKRAKSEATLAHKSTQFKTTVVINSMAHRKLQQGECSTAREEKSPQSPSFQYYSDPWRGEQRQQRQSSPTYSCDEQGFQLVKPAYWWRYPRDKLQPQQPKEDEQRRQRYLAHVRGKCLNCFSTEHRVAHCKNKSKCWKCLNSGHKAFSCPSWGSRFKHPPNRTPHQESLWSCGASDSLGEKRSSQEAVRYHNDRDFRPHRDDHVDTRRRGMRQHLSHSAWDTVSHCRDAVDCYNSTRCMGCDSGQSGYHSRHFPSPPRWGSRGVQIKDHQKLKTTKGNKRVSFANPLAQVLGESFMSRDDSCFLQNTSTFCDEVFSARFDPMREELLISRALVRHPTKEDYIRSMLCFPGWEPVASPERVEVVLGAPADELEGEIRETTADGAANDKAHEETEHQTFSTTNKKIQVGIPQSATSGSEPVSVHGLENALEELEIEEGESFNCSTPPILQTTTITHLDDIVHNQSTCTSLVHQSSVEESVAEMVEIGTDRDKPSQHVALTQTQPIAPAPARQVDDSDQFHNQVVNIPSVQQPPIIEVDSERAPNNLTLNSVEGEQIDDFVAFINFISGPPPAPILNTPPRVNPPQPIDIQPESATTQRKSTRLADKAKLYPGKDTVQLAQMVLINKLGELSPKEKVQAHLDFNKLAQHLPQPLTRTDMAAIQTLIEQGNQPKRKKRTKVAAEAMGLMT